MIRQARPPHGADASRVLVVVRCERWPARGVDPQIASQLFIGTVSVVYRRPRVFRELDFRVG
jgi:hypothetical protein